MYTDLSFKYFGHIYDHQISPVNMRNKRNKEILSHIEPLIVYIIEAVKQIKLQYMFSLDKNDTRVN